MQPKPELLEALLPALVLLGRFSLLLLHVVPGPVSDGMFWRIRYVGPDVSGVTARTITTGL